MTEQEALQRLTAEMEGINPGHAIAVLRMLQAAIEAESGVNPMHDERTIEVDEAIAEANSEGDTDYASLYLACQAFLRLVWFRAQLVPEPMNVPGIGLE